MVEQATFNREVARSIRAAPIKKKCSKCQKIKSLSQFGIKQENRRQAYCYVCQRDNSKKWYQENKEKHKRNVRVTNDLKRQALKRYIVKYLLKHSCVECGENDIVVLQFHHRRRSGKLMEISAMINALKSLEELKREIKKCDVLCANCHTRKEAKKNGSFKLMMKGLD